MFSLIGEGKSPMLIEMKVTSSPKGTFTSCLAFSQLVLAFDKFLSLVKVKYTMILA